MRLNSQNLFKHYSAVLLLLCGSTLIVHAQSTPRQLVDLYFEKTQNPSEAEREVERKKIAALRIKYAQEQVLLHENDKLYQMKRVELAKQRQVEREEISPTRQASQLEITIEQSMKISKEALERKKILDAERNKAFQIPN